MQSVADKYCPGWVLYSGTELVLDKIVSRDKTNYNYRLPPDVSRDDPQCLQQNVSFEQSLVDYVTTVTVVGAKDPITGKRLTYTESIPQADDKRFLNSAYYVGDQLKEVLHADDSLTDPKQLIMKARNRLKISSLTPDGGTSWITNARIRFDPDFRGGDVRKVLNKKCIVDTVQFASLNAGDGEMMDVKFQLAEDWE
jgi:hypothetical protein